MPNKYTCSKIVPSWLSIAFLANPLAYIAWFPTAAAAVLGAQLRAACKAMATPLMAASNGSMAT